MKILLVEAVLFHAKGQRDRMKLIAAFGNFTNTPKINMLLTTITFDFCSRFLKNIMSLFNNNFSGLDYGRLGS